MQPNTFITGFFSVNGEPDSVRVPCSGRGPDDYAALAAAMAKRHPAVARNQIVRTGATVSVQNGEEAIPPLDLDSGLTLRQIFDSPDGIAPVRTSLPIGKTFFNGSPFKVLLTYQRAAGTIGLTLIPLIAGGDTVINFGNKVSPMLPVLDLPRIVKEILGRDARALELSVHKSA